MSDVCEFGAVLNSLATSGRRNVLENYVVVIY